MTAVRQLTGAEDALQADHLIMKGFVGFGDVNCIQLQGYQRRFLLHFERFLLRKGKLKKKWFDTSFLWDSLSGFGYVES